MVNLSKDEVVKSYTDAKAHSREYFDKYDEYERLAGNGLRADLPPNMPKVNDGSLAALLLETPMRVLAQLQEGTVKVTDRQEPWMTELAQIVWTTQIVPQAIAQAPFLNKVQTALYKALCYGSQPAFDFFAIEGDKKRVDFVLPYVRDVYLEPGKVSDQDSDHIFMVTYYTKLQIQNIIESAKAEDKAAKAEGRESFNAWDIGALEDVLKNGKSDKDDRNKNAEERKKSRKVTGYKFVTCFQRGVDSEFYTFVDTENEEDAQVVRTVKNENPTGDIPVHFLYAYQDLVNPYGKGQIEISGGTQNVLDYFTQLDVLATQIGLQPPIKISGDRTKTNLNSMVYAPRQFWFTGQAVVEEVQTASQIYTQFPSRYGLYKTQLMNMQGTTDSTVSAESGAPGFSKTDAGVKQGQERTNAHDNFLRGQVASFMSRLGSSMLNTLFNSMEGSDVIDLIDEHAERLMRTGLIPMGADGKPDTKQLQIEWANVRGKFEFEVDPDSSIVKDDADQVEKLSNVIKMAQEDPTLAAELAADGFKFNKGEAYRQLFMKLGLQNIEKIIVPTGDGDGMDAENGADATQDGADPQLQTIMTQFGVQDPQMASQILQALKSGMSPQDIQAKLAEQQAAPAPAQTPAPAATQAPKMMVNYKDAPDSIKAQMEQADGFTPASQTERIAHRAMEASLKPAPKPPVGAAPVRK